jgi:type IV pilus assembly protein PilE
MPTPSASPAASARGRAAGGFTLIELLVIIMILAILMAVAFTNFSRTVERSADAAAISDLRNAMNAQEAYSADFESYAPLSSLKLSTSVGVKLGGRVTARGYRMTAAHQRSKATYVVEMGSGGSTEGMIVKD